jgi:hypothetical protein
MNSSSLPGTQLFAKWGYSPVDSVRPVIWWNTEVEWWYRQNIFLFAQQGHPLLLKRELQPAMDVVHPELLRIRCSEIEDLLLPQTVGALARALPESVGRSVREFFRRLFSSHSRRVVDPISKT